MKPAKLANLPAEQEPAFFSSAVAAARRFYLDLNPDSNVPVSVVCGGLEQCGRDYAIHRETFPFLSIEYVARGTGQLHLQGKSYALAPGTIFSYGPGIRHDITGDMRSPLAKYFVDFSGKNGMALLKLCQLAPGRVARVFPPDALGALFDELIHTGLSFGRQGGGLCVKLLECLALKIARVNAPLKDAETPAFVSYQQCREHIKLNFRSLRTLEQAASECHLDKAYLCRLFRRFDQQTPYHYLLSLKMNHAAELLQQPGILVKQAAEETGFEDPFHFSRVFRNILGVSPAKFRKMP